ncbi:MAG: PqqD family protein [Theionarchaea archaeon]|nr:PqqD family protein [Theionarchaea archaeon]
MELDYKPEKDERLITREEDVGLLIFDPNTGEVKVLNETAAAIWNSIDGEKSVANIIDAVVQENPDADPETVKLDVCKFIKELQDNTFINV